MFIITCSTYFGVTILFTPVTLVRICKSKFYLCKISLRNGWCHCHCLWQWRPSKSNMYPNRGIGKCYLCLLVHIECNKISLITLPLLWQEFSDITCEFFDLAFTLVNFPTFWACTSWYKLVAAGTSSKKFFVGLLGLCTIPIYLRVYGTRITGPVPIPFGEINNVMYSTGMGQVWPINTRTLMAVYGRLTGAPSPLSKQLLLCSSFNNFSLICCMPCFIVKLSSLGCFVSQS